jgi:F0F1-type ATP synthase gamma subunit
MANLKLIGMRLKSVKNIQKITQAVKMVSSSEADSNLSFSQNAK